jgi:hypothetical protein
MQPAADGGRALLYAVAHGRLVERVAVQDTTELAAFALRVEQRLNTPHRATLQPEEVDGTVILAAWLRARNEHDGYVFPLTGSAHAWLPDWSAALASILARVEDDHASAAL